MGQSASFNIEIMHRRVLVTGELETSTAPVLVDAVLALRGPVSVDLSGVTFIDSRGLQALLKLWRARPNLRIIAISERLARVLSITDTNFLIGRMTKVQTVAGRGAA